MGVGAFGSVFGKKSWVEKSRTGRMGERELSREESFVSDEEAVNVGCGEGVEVAAAVEGVDVDHHGGMAVDCGPMISENFLRPAAELVAGSAVCSDLLNGIAIANPVEVGSPNVRINDGEGPTTSGDFADEGVVMGFGGGATA